MSDNTNDPVLARKNQDKALEVLGLHRYRIVGDGNCLFRAVAKQLKLDQDLNHLKLRKASVKWMRENKDELLEWGLLDGEKEISETEKEGVWPGQAAIVALANVFGINIAVIQGGDKGNIDIQHICPFENAVTKEQPSIILAYLYNGHYDAVVDTANVSNPEFDAWTLKKNQELAADEAFARQLAEEEAEDNSTIQNEIRNDEIFARKLAEEDFEETNIPDKPVRDSSTETLRKQLGNEDYHKEKNIAETQIQHLKPQESVRKQPRTNIQEDPKPQTHEVKIKLVKASPPSKTKEVKSRDISCQTSPTYRHVSDVKVNYSQSSVPEKKFEHTQKRSLYDGFKHSTKETYFPKEQENEYSISLSPILKPMTKPNTAPLNYSKERFNQQKDIGNYLNDNLSSTSSPQLRLTLHPRPSETRNIAFDHSLAERQNRAMQVTRQVPIANTLKTRQFYDQVPENACTFSERQRAPIMWPGDIEQGGLQRHDMTRFGSAYTSPTPMHQTLTRNYRTPTSIPPTLYSVPRDPYIPFKGFDKQREESLTKTGLVIRHVPIMLIGPQNQRPIPRLSSHGEAMERFYPRELDENYSDVPPRTNFRY